MSKIEREFRGYSLEKILKLAVILLVVTATVFAAGCMDNKGAANNTKEASEQVTLQNTSMPVNSSWTFAVIGDTRGKDNTDICINNATVEAIAKDIVKNGCDLVLVVGDMVTGADESSIPIDKQFEDWKNAMSPVYSSGIKVYTVRGNHEYSDSSDAENEYIKAFGIYDPDNGPEGEKYLTYSFTHKNAFFLGLDEYADHQIHRVNQKWVNSQLANNSQPYIFVFGHEPAFKREHADCLATFPKERDELWNSIGKAGGHIYFCGHDHFYDRVSVPDNSGHWIYQVIDGSGGAPREKSEKLKKTTESSKFKLKYHNDDDYGYTLVTVRNNNVKVEWNALNISGNPEWVIKDSFQL